MPEITFIGAAGTVTGSKHLLHAAGKRIFVDCGLFQGTKDIAALNEAPLPVEPDDVDAVVITHGHLDHIGYLPRLVRDGFSGPIYATPATQALMQIVLDDAAHLQQHLSRRGFEHERDAPPPYYDERDVAHTMRLVRPMALDAPFEIASGIRATYRNAGHVIGSAFAVVETEERRIVFSGDLGRYGRPLLYDPQALGPADALVCESTYAARSHPADPLEELKSALLAGIERRGTMVMPAFAVERTQDLLLAIATLQEREQAIATLPVHLDSPMAERVDDLFTRFPDAHRPVANASATAPFGVRDFSMAVTTQESKALNELQGPHLIVSASGMASGGRVLHHLHNHIAQADATIMFVGYQSRGTLGSALMNGAKSVRIYGDALPVRAHVMTVGGFSGHADGGDLRRWFSSCPTKPHLYAVHGEPDSAAALAALAKAEFGWSAQAARRGTTVTV
ncbi:MAG: MBL fold metallo-hydrolase RNA specificity domain-containing protein [Candidatus Tyrphobacter sp.]